MRECLYSTRAFEQRNSSTQPESRGRSERQPRPAACPHPPTSLEAGHRALACVREQLSVPQIAESGSPYRLGGASGRSPPLGHRRYHSRHRGPLPKLRSHSLLQQTGASAAPNGKGPARANRFRTPDTPHTAEIAAVAPAESPPSLQPSRSSRRPRGPTSHGPPAGQRCWNGTPFTIASRTGPKKARIHSPISSIVAGGG
jgi:hypothetical protein